jgi:hypothetical protein
MGGLLQRHQACSRGASELASADEMLVTWFNCALQQEAELARKLWDARLRDCSLLFECCPAVISAMRARDCYKLVLCTKGSEASVELGTPGWAGEWWV